MYAVRHHSLVGDYTEFGVFKGRTFSAACALAEEAFFTFFIGPNIGSKVYPQRRVNL